MVFGIAIGSFLSLAQAYEFINHPNPGNFCDYVSANNEAVLGYTCSMTALIFAGTLGGLVGGTIFGVARGIYNEKFSVDKDKKDL